MQIPFLHQICSVLLLFLVYIPDTVFCMCARVCVCQSYENTVHYDKEPPLVPHALSHNWCVCLSVSHSLLLCFGRMFLKAAELLVPPVFLGDNPPPPPPCIPSWLCVCVCVSFGTNLQVSERILGVNMQNKTKKTV